MLAKERQDNILQLIEENGAVVTTQLSEKYNVSVETIRKDIIVLEKQGRLVKTHGGAVKKVKMNSYEVLPKRKVSCVEEKRMVSLKAAEFVEEGDIIYLDDGSTALEFASALADRFNNLTVATRSIEIFNVLTQNRGFKIILCGGIYWDTEKQFLGELTLETLKRLNFHKSFISPNAVSVEYGICSSSEALVPIQNQIIKSSDKVFVMVDNTKLEKRALYKICDAEKRFTYITDVKVNGEVVDLYKENGFEIVF